MHQFNKVIISILIIGSPSKSTAITKFILKRQAIFNAKGAKPHILTIALFLVKKNKKQMYFQKIL